MKKKEIAFKPKRLLALADYLTHEVPRLEAKFKREVFFYGAWTGGCFMAASGEEKWYPEAKSRAKSATSCGTTACAFGWATAVPSLRRLGLELRRRDGRIVPCLPRKDVLDSAADVFGITLDEAAFLFTPNQAFYDDLGQTVAASPKPTATVREVAALLRRFVEFKETGKWPSA